MWEVLLDYTEGIKWVAIGAVVLSFIFLWINLSKRSQAVLDLLWICAGSFGIIAITEANRKEYFQYKTDDFKEFLTREKAYIIDGLSMWFNCREYESKSEWMSNEQFEELQRTSKAYCEWTKSMLAQIQSTDSILTIRIESPNGFTNNPFYAQSFEMEKRTIDFYNEKVLEYNSYKDRLEDNSASSFRNTYGLLILYLGITLRLGLSGFRVLETFKGQKKGLDAPEKP